MPTPLIADIKVTYPGDLGLPSYLDVEFLGSALFGTSIYDAWCASQEDPLFLTPGPGGSYVGTFKATVYSSYEPALISANLPGVGGIDNLDNLNWLLNQFFNASGYTSGEVQAAIWTLLGDDYTKSHSLGAHDPAKITQLVNLALQPQNDGYRPDITDADPNNDYMALILNPFVDTNGNLVRDGDELAQQPLLIQVRSAALGNRVWHDVNGNGLQDLGEQGISGVVVKLVRDLNNDSDFDDANEVLATGVTGGDGTYLFTGLAPGLDYRVMFMTPAGFDGVSPRQTGNNPASDQDSDGPMSDVVVLAAGEYNPTLDAGFYQSVSVGNYVWHDVDQDGIQDGAEIGISGVKLTLTGTTGAGAAVTRTTTTGADGGYLFDALPPGTYSVTVDAMNFAPGGALEGYTASPVGQGGDPALDSNATPTGTSPVFLPSGSQDPNLDFGYYRPSQPLASLGDRVWLDTDANGVQDAGEVGVGKVTVRLYACIEAGGTGPLLRTTTTSDGTDGKPVGFYEFTGLQAGNYKVEFVAPDGYVFTSKDMTTEPLGSDSDAYANPLNADYGFTDCYTVNAGENVNTVDAGLVQRRASLGDRVWEDANANGIQDDGEVGKSGVTVELYTCVNNAPGVLVDSKVTDGTGNYSFTGLLPGDYIVKFIAADGSVLSQADQTVDDKDSDANPANGLTGCYTLAAGENNTTVDAGYHQKASLGDRVWLDTNANGVQDGGEVGVSNVTVRLYACIEAGGTGPLLRTTVTSDGTDGKPVGFYEFTGLQAGNYKVQFVAPNGYAFTSKDVTAEPLGSDSDAYANPLNADYGFTDCYTVNAGDSITTVDAGLVSARCLVDLGDRVWFDSNDNGIQDGGEVGLAGVAVHLIGAGADGQFGTPDDLTRSTVTDGQGKYLFTDLEHGQYKVRIELSTGSLLSKTNMGGDDTTDSDFLMKLVPDGTFSNKDLIVNGSFEALALLGKFQLLPSFAGWTGSNDSIELGRASVYGASGASGEQVVELDANSYYTGGLYQTVQTEAGKTYQLSFDAAQRMGTFSGTNTIEVYWAGVKIASVDPTSTTFQTYSFDVVGTGGLDKLEFREQAGDSDGYGGLLDNVRLLGSVANTKAVYESGIVTIDQCLDDLSIDAGVIQTCQCDPVSFDFSGAAPSSGTAGNILNFTVNGVAVNVSGFSRGFGGTWNNAYVGAYGDGLGVTDGGEGSGAGSSRVVDNSDRNNYLLFEFSTKVVIDQAFLASVFNDSDISVWIGNLSNAYNSHVSLTDTVLAGLGFKELSQGNGAARWADLNAGEASGNVLVVAAAEGNDNDAFTLQKIDTCALTCFSPATGCIGDRVWEDRDHDGIQDVFEPGIGGVAVRLLNASSQVIATTQTDATGHYRFDGLSAGSYRVMFDKSDTVYQGQDLSGVRWAKKDVGADDSIDGDAYSTTDIAYTDWFDLAPGQCDLTRDAGITPIVIDLNGDGVRTVARADSAGTFDLLGTGVGIHSGWLSGEDGFLAVDGNGNGRIDGIGELFGGSSKGDGFAKLAGYDSNGDGVVDATDAGYADLKVWRDANGNHQTDAGELMSLAEAGVASLKVGYIELPDLDANGNLHLERSSATLADGSVVDMTDVYFNVAAADAAAAGVGLPSLAELVGDGASLDGLLASLGGGLSMAVNAAPAADAHDSGAADALRQMAELYDQALYA